jgi:mRNA interferase YafQ
MFNLVYTNRFRKDVKVLQRRDFNMDLLKNAVILLEESGPLPANNKPHKLSGHYSGFWEAHLNPDWLIIWKVFPEDKEVWLTRTGTHSDLF